MFSATYFVRECPICGRTLQIRLEYLGRSVACQHCNGHFTASDPATHAVDPWHHGDDLLSRVNQLLEPVSSGRSRPR